MEGIIHLASERDLGPVGTMAEEEEENSKTVLYKYVSGHYPSSTFYLKHCPVCISKHNISETRFCLCLQVKLTKLGPINRAIPCLWPGDIGYIDIFF
jgi:hypothetical protein